MSSESAGSDPHAAAGLFALLSDGTRVRIVQELYAHRRCAPEAPCLAFSDLYSRVDAEDSGRFNYHLERLCDTLVEKRESGYALTPLGTRLAQLVSDDGAVTLPDRTLRGPG